MKIYEPIIMLKEVALLKNGIALLCYRHDEKHNVYTWLII